MSLFKCMGRSGWRLTTHITVPNAVIWDNVTERMDYVCVERDLKVLPANDKPVKTIAMEWENVNQCYTLR